MLPETPTLLPVELEAIEQIAELREQLRWATAEPRRWLGGLRRLSFARAVQGSNSIEGYDAGRGQELWNGEVSEPVAGGWPLLEVDTDQPVAVDDVLAFIRAALDP